MTVDEARRLISERWYTQHMENYYMMNWPEHHARYRNIYAAEIEKYYISILNSGNTPPQKLLNYIDARKRYEKQDAKRGYSEYDDQRKKIRDEAARLVADYDRAQKNLRRAEKVRRQADEMELDQLEKELNSTALKELCALKKRVEKLEKENAALKTMLEHYMPLIDELSKGCLQNEGGWI